jgi:hypothetical protein
MNILKNKLITFVSLFSILFYLVITLNLTPFLRGPNDNQADIMAGDMVIQRDEKVQYRTIYPFMVDGE